MCTHHTRSFESLLGLPWSHGALAIITRICVSRTVSFVLRGYRLLLPVRNHIAATSFLHYKVLFVAVGVRNKEDQTTQEPKMKKLGKVSELRDPHADKVIAANLPPTWRQDPACVLFGLNTCRALRCNSGIRSSWSDTLIRISTILSGRETAAKITALVKHVRGLGYIKA